MVTTPQEQAAVSARGEGVQTGDGARSCKGAWIYKDLNASPSTIYGVYVEELKHLRYFNRF